MILFSVLGSGSRGNSVYVESRDTAILLDCGFSGKETAARLRSIGKDLEDLDAILVTHEHIDHVAGVGVLGRKCKIPIYANNGTFEGADKRIGKIPEKYEIETGVGFSIHDMLIKPFRISHDTQDPVGYVIESGGVRIGYCTDTGKATHLMAQRLKGCNGLILEFNHDPIMLKEGPYPLSVQQRVRSSHGHLSNKEAANFLEMIWHEDMQVLVLAHLSETNNIPKLAEIAVDDVKVDKEITKVVVARQHEATKLFKLY